MVLLTHNLLSLCVLVDHIYSIKRVKIFPIVIMSVIFEHMNKPRLNYFLKNSYSGFTHFSGAPLNTFSL